MTVEGLQPLCCNQGKERATSTHCALYLNCTAASWSEDDSVAVTCKVQLLLGYIPTVVVASGVVLTAGTATEEGPFLSTSGLCSVTSLGDISSQVKKDTRDCTWLTALEL